MANSIPRAHSVTQMMPASDWFFRFETAGQLKLVRLAAWGLDHDGRVVGMVSPSTADFDYAHLVMVPANSGVYLHLDELTPEERQLINQDKRQALKKLTQDLSSSISSVGN